MIAIGLRSRLFSIPILRIMVRGTERNMPTGPQSHPQNTRERKITRVDMPRVRPISCGSTRLPRTTFTTTNPAATRMAWPGPS